MEKVDVLIIGAGPAGLVAGIHLAQHGVSVVVLEKETFPRHKVCGEYVSREVLPYLKKLGVDLEHLKPKRISKFQFTSAQGKSLEAPLALGGLGLSRYAFDNHLYQKAVRSGVVVKHETVISCFYIDKQFHIETRGGTAYHAKQVLGAFGKRSNLDLSMARLFARKKSPWMAIKEHYEQQDFPDDLVALHNFSGGYCGLSKTESHAVNVCYLTRTEPFRTAGNTQTFSATVLSKNPFLSEFLSTARPLFKKPLSIAQISFEQKSLIENHILMLGDAAGLLHPLCGNGMAMAVHSAKLAAELSLERIQGNLDQQELECRYKHQWNQRFNSRIRMGRLLQGAFVNKEVNALTFSILKRWPGLLQKIISSTHGTYIS